jgi:hypothetical protein
VLGDSEAARRYSAESVELAQALGDREIERDALRVLGPVVAELGDTAEGERLLRRSLALARDGDGAEPTVEAYVHLSHLAARTSVTRCLAIADEGIANTQRLGLPLGRTGPLLTLAAMAHFFNGDWDGRRADVGRGAGPPHRSSRGDDDSAGAGPAGGRPGVTSTAPPPCCPPRRRSPRGAASGSLIDTPPRPNWRSGSGKPDQAGLSVGLATAALGGQVDPDLSSWLIALAERAVADKVEFARAVHGAGLDAEALPAVLAR